MGNVHAAVVSLGMENDIWAFSAKNRVKCRRGREHGCIGIGLGRKGIFGCGALWVSIPTETFTSITEKERLNLVQITPARTHRHRLRKARDA